MGVEIRPEPSPDEREVILRALEELDGAAGGDQPPTWWLAGVREVVDEDEDV